MNNTTTEQATDHKKTMYEAAKQSYLKEAAALKRVIGSKILSASVFFTCNQVQTGEYFSHQVVYKHDTGGIPPEFTDFIKLHIDALEDAAKLIDEKILTIKPESNVDNNS